MTRDEVMGMTDDSLWWKALRCLHGDIDENFRCCDEEAHDD